MREFVGLRAKAYSDLIDDSSEDNNTRGTKKCVIKRKLKFKDYKNCLEATKLENKKKSRKKIIIDSPKNHKHFIRNNKLI